MAKVLVNEDNLTNIANAIREKNGSAGTYKPSEMAAAINSITIATSKVYFSESSPTNSFGNDGDIWLSVTGGGDST